MISIIVALALGQVVLKDEGTTVGAVNSINCTGAGVACSRVGSAGELAVTGGGGSADAGTVTSVSVTTANGVSGSVATPTTTPAITLTLGAVTPSSVAASGTVTGSNLSGTNTGDQTKTCGAGSGVTTLAAGTSSTCAAFAGGTGTASGTNTGDLTLGAFGSAPAAEGASLAGQVLTLQPADSTHPGGISLGNQTFPGAGFIKTFEGQVNHDHIIRLNGTNSIQFFGSSANAIRYATGTLTGLQFTSAHFEFSAGVGTLLSHSNVLIDSDKTLGLQNGANTATLESNVTANRTITVPDATGTLVVAPSACAAGQAATSNGTVLSCTSTLTASTNANLTGPVTSVGNATTIANAVVGVAHLSATGTPSAGTYLRGDNTWTTPGGTSPLTTKGDLYTFTTVDARLPTSTDGLCLKTNAATATGLEWNTCAAASAGNAVEVTVTMPSDGSGWAQTVVTGQAWVTATSKIACQPFNDGGDSNNTDEVYSLAEFSSTTSTRVVSTGFTLTAASPNGVTGVFKFHCLGV